MKRRIKEGLEMISYPLVGFVIFVFAPFWPTIWLVLSDYHKIWLILTIGWAVMWIAGVFIWKEERGKKG
jgi:hypothetical protein